jgi:hypothetical protein
LGDAGNVASALIRINFLIRVLDNPAARSWRSQKTDSGSTSNLETL